MSDSENLNKLEMGEPSKKKEKLEENRESLKDIQNVEKVSYRTLSLIAALNRT